MTTQHLHTYCAMCVSRCGVVATVEDGRLQKVNADPAHPNSGICVKGAAASEIVYSPDRLQYPMRRTRPKGDPDPGWVRISWEEAMTLTASRLLEIKAQSGAEAVVFGVSTPAGGASSDYWHWLHRLARAFGSPNIAEPYYVCGWHKGIGSQYTYGVGLPVPDYDQANCILLWGRNPKATTPTDAMRISQARSKGAKLIVIDPRQTSLAREADLWLQVRPGSDGALALAMIHVLLEEDLYDAAFTAAWTNGSFLVRMDTGQLLTAHDLSAAGNPDTFVVWDVHSRSPVQYQADRGYAQDGVEPALFGTYTVTLAAGQVVACRPALALLKELVAPYAPEWSEALTWVPAGDVRRAVRLFASEGPSCYDTWVGLEQSADAMQTNRAVCCFYALTGQFDQRGSNVLFASTPTQGVMGQELLPAAQAARALGAAERPLGPAATMGVVTAYDLYGAILSGQPYPVRALVSFGGDLLVGYADPLRGKAALEALDFYVHVDLVANPSAGCADLLLPAATCWERAALLPSFGAAEDTSTWMQLRPIVVQPLHESRPDLEILFELATRLGLGEHFFEGDIDAAFNYRLAPSGITVQQLRQHPMGMRAEGQTRHQKYAEIDERTGQPQGFETPTRKLEIYSTRFAQAGYAPLPVLREPITNSDSGPEGDQTYPLLLTFFRVIQFCDEQHRNIPRLRRQLPEPFLEIHPSTAQAAGIADGEWVALETVAGSVRLKAKYKDAIHPRVVATPYGWWQGCQELGLPGYDPFTADGANANLLIPTDTIDPISGCVPHRGQRCRVRKTV